MRTLHTLKGGARLAGAMRLGEMAHRLETRIERLTGRRGRGRAPTTSRSLQAVSDAMAHAFEAMRSRDAQAYADAVAAAIAPPPVAPAPARRCAAPSPPRRRSPLPRGAGQGASRRAAAPGRPAAARRRAGEGQRQGVPSAGRRARRGRAAKPRADRAARSRQRRPARRAGRDRLVALRRQRRGRPAKPAERAQVLTQSAVRVRAPLLDRLVNQAGEVSITRSRIESGVGQIKGSLSDLTENLERLRGQLRDIELQGEVQMSSRLEAAKAASQAFDPLEFDRFTRFQELTRMMAESVNDVATVQRTLQRSLEHAEDELVAQARLTRDLQDDLLRTRMVEFEGLSDRLYRVVRLTAKETGKQVRLDIVGGSIEVDRGVLDRMTGAFEHLLRNCVAHGIELPEASKAAGKDADRDDRRRALARRQRGRRRVPRRRRRPRPGAHPRQGRGDGPDRARQRRTSDAELANLIFTAGFSTAETVTELAGRGVGMDVVRSEVIAMGGRIETATAAGQGTSFKLVLPLTTAVTQVVMLRCGESMVAVPSTLVEIVRRATPEEVDAAYASGALRVRRRRRCRSSGSARLLQLGAPPADARRRERAPSSSSAAPSSGSRSTSTKSSATRKSWSRTSGRSCRACPASPA